ncbi:MAG: hypothetical protein ACOC8I_03570 [Desulfosalsimonas sp.]
MNLLIDFVNVREWSVETLFNLHKKHDLCKSVFPMPTYIKNMLYQYNKAMDSEAFPGRRFFFENDDFATERIKAGLDTVLPDDTKRYQELFKCLRGLQKHLLSLIEDTVKEGPQPSTLNKTIEIVGIKVEFRKSKNPFKPSLKQYKNITTIEDMLFFDYLHPFLVDKGEQFKKLRTCKNSDCGAWFLYNRPKQVYCSDACRHANNNRTKIKSGYLAAHQRKGRSEKPNIYNY